METKELEENRHRVGLGFGVRGFRSGGIKIHFLFALALILFVLPVYPQADQAVPQGYVYVLSIDGTVDLGTANYIRRGIGDAQRDGKLIIVKVSTENGLVKPMEWVVDEIVDSDVKVVGFASRKFKGAYSSGAYVVMSADVCAIDPQSHIGYAQPRPVENSTILPMAEYMERLADLHERNTEAVRLFVENNSFMTGKDAVKSKVADTSPESIDEILTSEGLSGVPVRYINPSLDDGLYSLMSIPQFISVFYLLGCLSMVYLLKTRKIQESPRLVALPLLCFIICLWSLQNMMFSVLGFLLVSMGIGLVASEMVHMRSTICGGAGIVTSYVGIILIDAEPFFMPTVGMLVVSLVPATLILAVSVIIANKIGREDTEKAKALHESMIGQVARVVEDLRPNGLVKIDDRIWQAYSMVEEKIEVGSSVEIIRVDGRVLDVIREGAPRKGEGHGHGHDDHGGDEHGDGGGHH